MISGWIAEKGLHCTLNIGMWESQGRNEPAAWGILLADVIRHVANAIQESNGVHADETARTIMDALEAEFSNSTSAATGGFHPGHT
jgi:hypothetical protein